MRANLHNLAKLSVSSRRSRRRRPCRPQRRSPIFGKPGDPIKLTVGYQPLLHRGVVGRGDEVRSSFWKKYLPAGSEVEFEPGLQGQAFWSAR